MVCDCKKSYWHQELDDASSLLTTFNTEIWRFQHTVMPFGITVAGEVFQQLDQYFGHIKNVIVIANDIMIVGKKHNHRDHNLALAALLETARRCNVHLNYDKLQYKKTDVFFFAETYIISRWKPAQTKVSAITSMPEPSCKKQEQSFIGMVNYLSKFSTRLSELAKPLESCPKTRFHSSGAQSTEKP